MVDPDGGLRRLVEEGTRVARRPPLADLRRRVQRRRARRTVAATAAVMLVAATAAAVVVTVHPTAVHAQPASIAPASSASATASATGHPMTEAQIAALTREVKAAQTNASASGANANLVALEKELIEGLRAEGAATAAQLAWLALPSAQQLAQASSLAF